MLNPQLINKIEEFVYEKPRSVQEIASLIKKNWRTADRYLEEIKNDYGTIATRVFREGTRGALKIAYWASIEKASYNMFQKKLETEILNSKRKEDFSAFDIFQHVPEPKRECFVFEKEEDNMKDFSSIMLSAKKQLLIFSGNLSFINLQNKRKDMFNVFEELAKRKIKIKILSRVDLSGINNVEKILSLNLRHGRNIVEIRHDTHPLRGVIIDNKFIRLKEVKEPTGKIKELNKRLFIFYNIKDKTWAEWLSKIFWNKFAKSIDANKRLEHLKHVLNG